MLTRHALPLSAPVSVTRCFLLTAGVSSSRGTFIIDGIFATSSTEEKENALVCVPSVGAMLSALTPVASRSFFAVERFAGKSSTRVANRVSHLDRQLHDVTIAAGPEVPGFYLTNPHYER